MTRKATAATLIAAALLAASMFFAASASAQGKAVKWSLLVYFAADNHLDADVYGVPLIDSALERLTSVGSTDDVAVYALVDRRTGADRLFKANKGSLEEITGFAPPGSQINTGDPATLRRFVTYTESLTPADNTALIVWDSGSLGYIATDTQGAPIHGFYNYDIVDYLTHLEAIEALDGLNVDILGADECNVGYLELAYEYAINHTAQYLLAGPTFIGWRGFPYDALVGEMTKNPDMTPRDAAVMMVEQRELFVDQPPYQMERTNAFSAIDLAKVEDLAAKLNVLTGLLKPEMARYIDIVSKARAQANMAYAQNPMNRIDLMTFVQVINANSGGTKRSRSNSSAAVHAASRAVMSAIDASVAALQTTGTTEHMTSGLGIYMPNQPSELPESSVGLPAGGYNGYAFPPQGWMAFLEAYWAAHGKT